MLPKPEISYDLLNESLEANRMINIFMWTDM